MSCAAHAELRYPLIRVEQYTFLQSTSFKHPQKVYNVIPGDFTQDGRLDLLVYGQSSRSGELSIQLYTAQPQGGFSEFRTLPVFPHPSTQDRQRAHIRTRIVACTTNTRGYQRRPQDRPFRYPLTTLVFTVQGLEERME